MYPEIGRKQKSVAALTARQYREAKKRELESLKMQVRFLQNGFDYYKSMFEKSQVELQALADKCSMLEEVIQRNRIPHGDSRITANPSVSQSLTPELGFDLENEPYFEDFIDPVLASLH